ncbi:hypothetical protein HH308_21350 [Gordonia sp. TBRC 11910]|uniref:Uncharacterized protein n=1 Tax=Gordonia asplenii TaxID=2725283 RepID=A0A848KYU6_9ACTN|nr:hypothetical protein [Gordonia asplenii]NMO03766.1 hypothetical protein [Gordonia asplenii]
MSLKTRGTLLLVAACTTIGASTAVITATPVQAAPFVQPVAAQPSVGDPCIGAEIGRRTTDPEGRNIVCDNYRWAIDVGQRPRHPWVDDQTQ